MWPISVTTGFVSQAREGIKSTNKCLIAGADVLQILWNRIADNVGEAARYGLQRSTLMMLQRETYFVVSLLVGQTQQHKEKSKGLYLWCPMVWMFGRLTTYSCDFLSLSLWQECHNYLHSNLCVCAVCKLWSVIFGRPTQTICFCGLRRAFNSFHLLISVGVRRFFWCEMSHPVHRYFALWDFVCKRVCVCYKLSALLCWRWRRRCFFFTGYVYLSVCPSVSQYSC